MEEDNVLTISEFSWKEFHRLINMIPEVDPTTPGYGTLLEAIERYGAIYKFVDWALSMQVKEPEKEPDNIIQFNPPVAEDEKFEEPDDQSHSIAQQAEEMMREKVEQYDAAVVKKALQDARMTGKISSVKDWIRELFGVDGFQALPAKQYGAVMAKLKELE